MVRLNLRIRTKYNWSDDSWILLALVSIVVYCLPFTGGFGGHWQWPCSIVNALTYHFFHANIWHLLGNLYALWFFKPKRETCIIGYVIASIVALVPFASLPDQMTCGLSGLLFAGYARRYVILHLDVKWFLFFTMITAFIPHLNWRVHILCFIFGLIIWKIKYGRR